MHLNLKIVAYNLGYLLLLESIFLAGVAVYSLLYSDGLFTVFLISTLVTIISGLLLQNGTGLHFGKMSKRDIYLTVFFGWVIMSIFGSLPYILSGAIPNFVDALFETVSGFTTTGATILTDIEIIPRSILLWRSLTQWIGGMGIIVLIVAILPAFGIEGIQLFEAESPGVSAEKFRPGIKKTAKAMWLVYVGLTLIEVVILLLVDVSIFDAVNHSLTTLSTGGFSTHSASIAHFSPLVQYVIVLFMFIAGTNFALVYLAFNGNAKRAYKNEEWRYYVCGIIFFVAIVFYYLYSRGYYGLEESFRTALFQIVSIVTTTGFITADLTVLAPIMAFLFFLLLFVGGMTGSTSGSVKIMRLVLLCKESLLVLRKQLLPSGTVMPLRFNRSIVRALVIYRVLVFIILYIFLIIFASGIMLLLGVDMPTAFSSVATTLGNVGPGLGLVGPVGNFSEIPHMGKYLLTALMIIGRLELFTVLVIITPWFWKN